MSRAHQRLRRGPRGRADLPPDPAAREIQAPGQAAVAAEHDAGGDPRGLRQPAPRRGHAGPGRRRAQPQRGRLAGGHQRHARDDGLQLARRRLLPHHRGPRADADAVDRGRARGKIRKHVARDYWEIKATFAAEAGEYEGKWFDPKWKKNPTTRKRAPTASGPRPTPRPSPRPAAASRRTSPRRPSRARRPAPALRPDHAAARGQLALRLLGQDHAVDRAGAVREAQGADLPAYRFARAAGGLPRRGQEAPWRCSPRRICRAAARTLRRMPRRR